MDAFPSLVVYLSLLALQSDTSLWRFHTDKNLIFLADDYKAPQETPVWNALAKNPDTRVVVLADVLASMCRAPVTILPSLRNVVAEAGIRLPGQRSGPGVTGQSTPGIDWLSSWQSPAVRTGQVTGTEPAPDRTVDAALRAFSSPDWLADHVPGGTSSRTQPVPVPGTREVTAATSLPGPTVSERPAPHQPARQGGFPVVLILLIAVVMILIIIGLVL